MGVEIYFMQVFIQKLPVKLLFAKIWSSICHRGCTLGNKFCLEDCWSRGNWACLPWKSLPCLFHCKWEQCSGACCHGIISSIFNTEKKDTHSLNPESVLPLRRSKFLDFVTYYNRKGGELRRRLSAIYLWKVLAVEIYMIWIFLFVLSSWNQMFTRVLHGRWEQYLFPGIFFSFFSCFFQVLNVKFSTDLGTELSTQADISQVVLGGFLRLTDHWSIWIVPGYHKW